MRFSQASRIGLIVWVVAVAFSAPASGDTITTTASFAYDQPRLFPGGRVTAGSQTVALARFDPSLGTLNSVTFSMHYNGFANEFLITNNEAAAGGDFATLWLDSLARFKGTGSDLTMGVNSQKATLPGPFAPGATPGSAAMLAGGRSFTTADAKWLTAFTATSPGATFNAEVRSSVSGISPAGISSHFSDLSSGQFTGTVGVTYQYTAAPVPLPAAAWGGMALLGGLGLTKRLRRRKDGDVEIA